jgi:hypothetical protein
LRDAESVDLAIGGVITHSRSIPVDLAIDGLVWRAPVSFCDPWRPRGLLPLLPRVDPSVQLPPGPGPGHGRGRLTR